MKQNYETPWLEIDWFEQEDIISYSDTPFIPDTDEDDWFD